MRRNSIFIILLISVSRLNAQLLWKAEPQSGKPFYLFGTMHLGAGNFVYEHQELMDIIKSCDVIYTEVDSDKSQLAGKLTKYLFLPDDMKLSDSLSEAELQRLDSLLGLMGSPMLNAKTLDRFKPMYVQVLFTALMFKNDTNHLDTTVSVNQQVMTIAGASGIRIDFLETQDEQLKYLFEDASLGMQFRLLRKALNGGDESDSTKTMYLKLPLYYRSQNLVALQTVLNASSSGGADEAQLMESLLSERNKRWVEKMTAADAEKDATVMYAVGAGHLPGPGGLIELLRSRGCTVEPVWFR